MPVAVVFHGLEQIFLHYSDILSIGGTLDPITLLRVWRVSWHPRDSSANYVHSQRMFYNFYNSFYYITRGHKG